VGFFLGLDLGTQSVKAVVLDAAGRAVVAEASSPLKMISRDDGTREQLAEWWDDALHKTLQQIAPKVRQSVSAISVSGQQHGFVPMARDGSVLAPVKLWCDTSTNRQCEQIQAAFGGLQRCITEVGNPILPGYTASKILWLKQNRPDLYSRLATILLPHDYINFRLCGEAVMEFGDASGTGLLDIRKRHWHPGMLAAVDGERDLSDCLPRLAAPHQAIGQLLPKIAGELGLPAGIPVACGGGDNMMAAIGTGNVSPGCLTVSLGTSGTLFAYSDHPVIDESGTLAAFCDSTGGWLPLVCTMNCTVATELTRRILGIPLAELDERVGGVAPGSQGVMTLPFFQGERTPNLPDGRGCILGLNHENYRPNNLLRSAMESAVFGLRAGLDAFRRQGQEIAEVRLTGGGAKSVVWRQMIADVFNLPVSVLKVDEGAALGAAVQACWVESNESSNEIRLPDLVAEILERDETSDCDPSIRGAADYEQVYASYQQHLQVVTPLYK
jgi:xylulokinase